MSHGISMEKKQLDIAFALASSYEDIRCTAQVFRETLRRQTPLAKDPPSPTSKVESATEEVAHGH